jgi:hypothetical protein
MLKYIRKLTYVEALFDHRRGIRESDVTLSASYMEIYRDEVYDLFVDRETVGLVLAVYSGTIQGTLYKRADSPLSILSQ